MEGVGASYSTLNLRAYTINAVLNSKVLKTNIITTLSLIIVNVMVVVLYKGLHNNCYNTFIVFVYITFIFNN